ncbi:hypothetical protein KSS87_001076, partial [Heliosperma pusillum]
MSCIYRAPKDNSNTYRIHNLMISSGKSMTSSHSLFLSHLFLGGLQHQRASGKA